LLFAEIASCLTGRFFAASLCAGKALEPVFRAKKFVTELIRWYKAPPPPDQLPVKGLTID